MSPTISFNLNAQQQNLMSRLIRSRPINLFGFQNAFDLELFLKTTAGKGLVNQISKNEANEVYQQRQFQDYNLRAQLRLRFLLLLWLINKQVKAGKSQHSLEMLIIECQQLQLKQLSDAKSKNLQKLNLEKNSQFNDVLELYDHTINEYQSLLKQLELEESQIESEIKLLENIIDSLVLKHQFLNNLLEEFSDNADRFDSYDMDHLQQIILETQTQFSSLPNYKQFEKQTLRLKLQHLHAYSNFKNNNQTIYSANGEKVQSFHHADFILNPGFKLAVQNNKIYLLKKGQQIESLSEEEKYAAENHFIQSKPELTTLRFSIQNSIKNEKEFQVDKLQRAQEAKINCHNARNDINNKLSLLHSVRASITNSKESYEVIQGALAQLTLTPKPSSPKVSIPSVDVPKKLYEMTKETHQKHNLRLTPAMLTRKIDRSNYNVLTKEEMKNLLRQNFIPFNINIYSMTPIPPQAFNLMLQNMARLAANPYRPGISNLNSPLESKVNKTPVFNPTPKPKGY